MDRATPNLPSRDFARTSEFYARLGFEEAFRDGNWMILRRGGLTLEFFPHPALVPGDSWFSCCLWLDDLDAFYRLCRDAGIPEDVAGAPRLHPAQDRPGVRMAALIDLDGTLLRLLQD